MIRVFTSGTQKIGEIGEKLAEKWLRKKGFRVLARNYSKRGGEIDIVALRADRLHFFEVKTFLCNLGDVSGETYNPMQNISPKKIAKLVCVVDLFFLDPEFKRMFRETAWQLDGLAVYYDSFNKLAEVEWLENINI